MKALDGSAVRHPDGRQILLLALAASLPACRAPLGAPPQQPQSQPPTASDITSPTSEGAVATAGPGLAISPDLETARIATWDDVQSLHPPRWTWPDLPGRATGVLWANSLYDGRDDCAARTANDRVEYHFSSGPHSPYALYFASDGRGFNFLRQWIVPLPDATTVRYDAAMFGAGTANPWGLHACAHLVELDVNDGRGGRGLHFVATRVRVLDDTTAYPWSLARLLLDIHARAHDHAAQQADALAFTRSERGPWREQLTSRLIPTWIDPPGRLDVLVWQTATRTAERGLASEIVTPETCPPGSPCMRRDAGKFQTFEVLTESVEFAVRFEVDATGTLTRETIYAPRRQTTDRTERRRVH